MIFPMEHIQTLDITILVFLFVIVFSGYRKGFLLSLIDLIGTIAILFIGYYIAPILANSYPLAKEYISFTTNSELLDQLIFNKIDMIIYFVIVYLVGSIAILIIKACLKGIGEIPFLKQINEFLGAILGVVKWYIACFVVVLVMSTPLIKNGSIVIERSLLSHISNSSKIILQIVNEPNNIDLILQDIANGNGIAEEKINEFKTWLIHQVGDEVANEIIKEVNKE